MKVHWWRIIWSNQSLVYLLIFSFSANIVHSFPFKRSINIVHIFYWQCNVYNVHMQWQTNHKCVDVLPIFTRQITELDCRCLCWGLLLLVLHKKLNDLAVEIFLVSPNICGSGHHVYLVTRISRDDSVWFRVNPGASLVE